MKTCVKCGGEIISTIGSAPYTGCGFEVILGGVELLRCSSCGATGKAIPNLAGLHRAIVRELLQTENLTDGELRFLRDFAVDPNPEIADLIVRVADMPQGPEIVKAFAAREVERQVNDLRYEQDPNRPSPRSLAAAGHANASRAFSLSIPHKSKEAESRKSWEPQFADA